MTALAMLALLFPVLAAAAVAALTWRRVRVVRCPETRHTAAVRLSSSQAALFGTGADALRLSDCSRWPERESCGQECLAQLEHAPADCLVSHVLRRHYEGKRCVRCGRDVGHVDLGAHRPALLMPDGTTREWREIEPDCLLEMLEIGQPICWDCHIVQWLYREHGELVTERPELPAH